MARIDGRESERAFLRNKKKRTIDEHTCNITEKMMEDWLFCVFFSFVAFNKKRKSGKLSFIYW